LTINSETKVHPGSRHLILYTASLSLKDILVLLWA
jgi:hypothetical protein